MNKLIQNNISLKNLTSFKVGGDAKYFHEVSSIESLKKALKWTKEENIPYFVLGKGSNIVISDSGYNGLIIHLGKSFEKLSISGQNVVAQSGIMLNIVIKKAVENGLAGMEKMSGIPGTIGGAIRMNAGAFGQEIEQITKKVISLNSHGNIVERDHKTCDFSYRHSIFCTNNEIILECELEMPQDDIKRLENAKQEILIKRKSKQPLEYPNAGSMFKRPPGNFAGTLIEASGLKGYVHGGAAVSEKHANFIINKNNATAKDIYELSQKIIDKVKLDSGIILEREVIFLGEF